MDSAYGVPYEALCSWCRLPAAFSRGVFHSCEDHRHILSEADRLVADQELMDWVGQWVRRFDLPWDAVNALRRAVMEGERIAPTSPDGV